MGERALPNEIGVWRMWEPDGRSEAGDPAPERWEDWRSPELNSPRGTRYVRADIADRHKRERDRLLRLAIDARAWITLMDGTYDGIVDDLNAAIAACEGDEGDGTPPRVGEPTAEAGYQSLLRETAGKRLGATK